MKKFIFKTFSCVAFTLLAMAPVRAQTYPVTGTAGFDTGLQAVAYLVLDHVIHLGDANPAGATIQWNDGTFTSPGLLTCLGTTNTDPCYVLGTHRYGRAGTYQISITYNDPKLVGNGPSHTVTTTATISPTKDFVILSVGDSIASGEGDPVTPNNGNNFPNYGFWDDPWSDYDSSAWPDDEADELAEWRWDLLPSGIDPVECHRSTVAGPAQAVQKIIATNPGVTFIHYACSGAKITAGDTPATNAEDVVGQLRLARQRLPRIDALIISAGSNSLYGPTTFGNGFGGLVSYCLMHQCSGNADVNMELANAFANLPSKYDGLTKEINCINPDTGTPEPSCTDPKKQIPKLVLITEYMDPTHDQNGNYPKAFPPECPPLFSTQTYDDWVFFHDFVVKPLNQNVDDYPKYAASAVLATSELYVPTYAVTGIADDFATHGICAGDQRWVNDGNDSEAALGTGAHSDQQLDPLTKKSLNGTAHPNALGHADYRDRIYNAIVSYNPPVTAMSATAGNAPYTSGTWTNQDVGVTLAASNAIQESGVGKTFYAVDNPECKPNSDYPYNPPDNMFPDNPPGCLAYSGPITLTDPGKHTLTYFSENAQNFPEGIQTAQVSIDKNPPLSADPGTQTIHNGESAVYNVTVGHTGWVTSTVALNCQTDAPMGTCSVSPDSVSLDAATMTSTVTVTTSSGASAAMTTGSPARPTSFSPPANLRAMLTLATGILLVGMGMALHRRRWVRATSFAAVAILSGALAGCGGGGSSSTPTGNSGTPSGNNSTSSSTYTVTITGTSGTTTNTVQTTLVVQ